MPRCRRSRSRTRVFFDDLRRHAREVADLKAYQDNIFRGVDTAIVGLDLEGRVVSLNRVAAALLERSEAAARGTPYAMLLDEDLAARLLRPLAAAATGTQVASVHGDRANQRRRALPPLSG